MSKSIAQLPLIVLSSCAVLAVSACDFPNAFPRGYVHHDEPYKSPNPPQSSKFTETQRATMGPEQSEQFRMAVYSLVDNLTNRAGMPPKPIYVLKPEPMTPFYANLDNDLRESLRHVGYRLSDTPNDAYAMTYNVEMLGTKEAPVADGAPNVRITLYVHDKAGEEGRILTQESGEFYIKGAEKLNVRFASFPGTFIPEPTGPGGNFRE